MLTREENELLTRTGPGTPCGEFMRRYWQPVALSEELPQGGYPIPREVMGEELVLFRDDQGRVGLLDLHCSHRAADLSYGRLEDGGLRCIYHGWLYDVNGRCLETPAEPEGSNLKLTIRHPAYPCQEAGGVVFAYMGPGEPPLLPNYEIFSAPDDHRFVMKYHLDCNYLQGLEGNQDGIHTRFLHRNVNRENTQWRFGDVEETDFGVWGTGRPVYLLPSHCLTGGGSQDRGDGYMMYWRVPIDDTHHWQYIMTFRKSAPWEPGFADSEHSMVNADFYPHRNKTNRYLQDRELQHSTNYTGIGLDFPPQDACVNEGAGVIQDRTKERLGAADVIIIASRKLMLRSIRMVQEGLDPPGVIRDPEVNSVDPLLLKRNAPLSEQRVAGRLGDDNGQLRVVPDEVDLSPVRG